MDDRQLLREYVLHQSEKAFTELVRRHVDLVYGTALRVVGNTATAQDVVQAVFVRLAQKAWMVRDGKLLPAWLYRTAYHEACSLVRGESRRRHYETEAMKLASEDIEVPASWEQLRPLLDEAMHRLSRSEQNAVVLRYFENQSLREVGDALGTTEAAARMRTNRAVEKIRQHFARCGVTVASGALAAILSANVCPAAPVGLALSVSQASLASATSAGLFSHLILKTLYMGTKTKIALTAAVIGAVATIPIEIQREKISQLEAQLATTATPTAAPMKSRSRDGVKSDGLPRSLVWDLHGPLAEILKRYPGGARIPALVKLVEQTPLSELAQLLNEGASCPDAGLRELLEELVYAKWVGADPQGALAYANAKALRGEQAALNRVFIEWTSLDSKSALAAALKLDRTSLRAAGMEQVFAAWAKKDPQAAMAALHDLPPSQANAGLLQLINEQWARQDPSGAWAASTQITAITERNVVQDVIVRALADSDPQAAFDLFGKFPLGNQRLKTFTQIFQKWAAQDPSAALEALQQMPVGQGRTNGVQSVFSSWAGVDPQAALKGAQALPFGRDREIAVMSSLRGLAAQNPQAAGEYVAALSAGNSRNNLITAVAETWADSDPAAAFAWLKGNTVGNTFNTAASAMLAQMAEANPQDSLAYILQLPEGAKRDGLLETALGKWSTFANPESIAWAKANLEGPDLAAALAGIAVETSYVDAPAAVNLLNQMPNSAARDDAIANIAVRVSTMDMDTAAQWLQGLPNDMANDSRLLAYQNVINKWTGVDPAAAAAYVQNFAQDPNLGSLVNRVATTWAQSDGSAALKWADSLPAGNARDSAIAATVASWANADGAAAWNYAQSLPASDMNNNLLLSVATAWSKADPAAAAQAMATSRDENLSQALGAAATNYLRQDPLAASQWINTLPPGNARDVAVKSLISVEGRNDLPTAFNWAATIGNATTQGDQLNIVVQQWAQKDPAAAAAAVQNAKISEPLREALLNTIQTTPKRP